MAVERITIVRTKTAADPALAEAVGHLVAAYQPECIYLFGPVGVVTPARTATTTCW
jgi:hypothetical protein